MYRNAKPLGIVWALIVGTLLGFSIDRFLDHVIPEAQAQTRPSLASLQTQIDNIVNGSTVVGRAASAGDADLLGGLEPHQFVRHGDMPVFTGLVIDGDLQVTGDAQIWGRTGCSPQVYNTTTSAALPGLLKFSAELGKLCVADGTQWVPLH